MLPARLLLCVPGVLCGFPSQCWKSTAEDAGDAEEQPDRERARYYEPATPIQCA